MNEVNGERSVFKGQIGKCVDPKAVEKELEKFPKESSWWEC